MPQTEIQLTAGQILIDEIIKYGLVPKGTHKDNVLFHKALATERQQLESAVKYGQDNKTVFAPCNYINNTFKPNKTK